MKKAFLPCLITAILFLPASSFAQDSKPSVQLNHLAFYVVDLKTSTSFYHNILGLDTIPEPFHDGRHTWFSIGPKSHLHLIQGAKSKTEHEKNTHLCFSVLSVDAFIPVL